MRLFTVEKRSLENPSTSLIEFFGGGTTQAGVPVTPASSEQLSAVYGCVRVISETISALTFKVYERLDRGRREAPEHPVFRVVNLRSNREMSAMTLLEVGVGHLAAWGNMYQSPEYNQQGDLIALWPLLPDRTEPFRENGVKKVRTRIDGQEFILLPASDESAPLNGRYIQVPFRGFDGLKGMSQVQSARQSIGQGIAYETHSSNFFKQGAHFPYVVTHPGDLGETGRKKITDGLEKAHTTLAGHHRLAVLDEGMKLEQVGMPHDDAQFLESRKFSVVQIARFFRMQPHKIMDLDKATFSNIEQMSIEHVQDTLLPYARRIEQVYNWDLFTPEDRGRFFVEFNFDSLLRGDSKARSEFYRSLWMIGSLTSNEIRAFENLNPLEGDGADKAFVPLNMVPVDEASELDESGDAPPDTTPTNGESVSSSNSRAAEREKLEQRSIRGRFRLQVAYRALFKRAADHFVLREVRGLQRALQRALKSDDWRKQFRQELERFYEKFGPTIAREILPVLASYAELLAQEVEGEIGKDEAGNLVTENMVGDYSEVFVERYVSSSTGQINDLLETIEDDAEAQAAIETRLEQWSERRPDKVGFNEATRAGGALTRSLYIAGGVLIFRWVTVGKNCPYCNSLDGKVTNVETPFVPKNSDVEVEGEEPLLSRTNIGHPPLHEGCDCLIVMG